MDLGVSGLVSGFDWRSLVDQMVDVERSPQVQLFTEQDQLKQQKNAYASIKTQLSVLQNRLDALKDPDTFDVRAAASSDTKLASVTAAPGAPLGSFAFNVTQMATTARLAGTANIAGPLNPGAALNEAGFSTAITAGTFTVNGKQVTVAGTESLQEVLDAIGVATDGAVAAVYDSANDRITLASTTADPIVLGSATDTTNFLSVAKLHNNGSGTVNSPDWLGGINPATSLASINFGTAVEDDGAGAGSFKINGVTIEFSATGDSLQNVLDRITNSTAGVRASYDRVNDRIVLANKDTGDVGIAVEDVSGNFLAATGLLGGALERGKNLIYTVDNGGELISQSNTITEASSGIAGLSVTALGEGTVSVTVSSDTAKIKTAIQDFIAEYNKVQSIIDTQTASSTDDDGKVTAGLLSNESGASEIASKLRTTVYQALGSFPEAMNQLSDLGIVTNGFDNNLALDDEAKLDEALANNLENVKRLFTDEENGLAVKLDEYIEATFDDDGILTVRDETLADQIASIDTQMADMERIVQANKQRLIDSFIAMETAQAKINQQMSFLQQRFGSASLISSK